MQYKLKKIEDFSVTGDGKNAIWEQAEWSSVSRVNGEATYAMRFKVLCSEKGIYFLTDCEDRRLTCTMTEDYSDIFKEDVVEVFLQTDARHPVYFEYEISPLNVELPILVSHSEAGFHGWLPWHYKGARKVRKAVHVRGGPQASGATIEGWTAEFFIPYALLAGMVNCPPAPGSQWKANVYRIDYDNGSTNQWAWSAATGHNFHDYPNFGTFIFP